MVAGSGWAARGLVGTWAEKAVVRGFVRGAEFGACRTVLGRAWVGERKRAAERTRPPLDNLDGLRPEVARSPSKRLPQPPPPDSEGKSRVRGRSREPAIERTWRAEPRLLLPRRVNALRLSLARGVHALWTAGSALQTMGSTGSRREARTGEQRGERAVRARAASRRSAQKGAESLPASRAGRPNVHQPRAARERETGCDSGRPSSTAWIPARRRIDALSSSRGSVGRCTRDTDAARVAALTGAYRESPALEQLAERSAWSAGRPRWTTRTRKGGQCGSRRQGAVESKAAVQTVAQSRRSGP